MREAPDWRSRSWAALRAELSVAVPPDGVSTAGTCSNRAYVEVELGDVAPELVELAYDPQTAGGLLVRLPAAKGPALEAEVAVAGLFLGRIGFVEDGAGPARLTPVLDTAAAAPYV